MPDFEVSSDYDAVSDTSPRAEFEGKGNSQDFYDFFGKHAAKIVFGFSTGLTSLGLLALKATKPNPNINNYNLNIPQPSSNIPNTSNSGSPININPEISQNTGTTTTAEVTTSTPTKANSSSTGTNYSANFNEVVKKRGMDPQSYIESYNNDFRLAEYNYGICRDIWNEVDDLINFINSDLKNLRGILARIGGNNPHPDQNFWKRTAKDALNGFERYGELCAAGIPTEDELKNKKDRCKGPLGTGYGDFFAQCQKLKSVDVQVKQLEQKIEEKLAQNQEFTTSEIQDIRSRLTSIINTLEDSKSEVIDNRNNWFQNVPGAIIGAGDILRQAMQGAFGAAWQQFMLKQ